jgi:hypothetical protein
MLTRPSGEDEKQVPPAAAGSAAQTGIPERTELLTSPVDVEVGEDKSGELKSETSFLGGFLGLAGGTAGFLAGGPAGAALGSAIGELAGDIAAERTSMIWSTFGHALLYPKGVTMNKILLIVLTVTATIPNGLGARAAELPTYELMGFPISPHQFSALGSVHVQERPPVATLTLNGMPASPHQIAVLTRRRAVAATAPSAAKASFPTP